MTARALLPQKAARVNAQPLRSRTASTTLPKRQICVRAAEEEPASSPQPEPEPEPAMPTDAKLDELINAMREEAARPLTAEEIKQAEREAAAMQAKLEKQQREEMGEPDRKPKAGGEEWDDEVIQMSRVTKILKGGKLVKFRACVVSGNKKGKVGFGIASAKEVTEAMLRAQEIARKEAVNVPMNAGRTFPHWIQIKEGPVRIMLRPATEGTGVIAGGAVRVVLELAGYKNAFGKILGTNSAMNNARGTISALTQMRTWRQVADARGVTIDFAMGRVLEPDQIYKEPAEPAPEPVAT